MNFRAVKRTLETALAAAIAMGWFLASPAWGAAPAEGTRFTIDEGVRHQTIDGWGTCLIFWGSMAGPDSPYHDPRFIDAYARKLGCNILRIQLSPHALKGPSGRLDGPVPLGDDVQENIAKFNFEHERVKIFGQVAQYLRDNALEPERVKFMADFWSPPHWMKGPTGAEQSFGGRPPRPTPFVSFNGTDTVGGRLKQTPENLEQFGRYILAYTRGFGQYFGIEFDNISLQNELSFENPFASCTYLHAPGADGEREGGQYWQYAAALKAVKEEFEQKGISARIRGPHMGNIGEKPDNPWALNDQCNFVRAVKDHEDPELFDFLSIYTSNYIDPEYGAQMLSGFRDGKAATPHLPWAEWLYAPGFPEKPYWIAEMGGAREDWLTGEDGAPGRGAIRVAQNIHNAMVWGRASAYVYWQILGGRDRPGGGSLLSRTLDTTGKKFSAYRHFSRYVRPGAVRVETTPTAAGSGSEMDTSHSLNASAYVHDEDGTVTIVLVNLLPDEEDVQIAVPDSPAVDSYSVWRTKGDESFAPQPDVPVEAGSVSLTVPGYSVVTLYGQVTR